MAGSTISRYMMRIWDENTSLAICGLYGKTTLTQYSMGRWEYHGMKIPLLIWKCKLRFISVPIWKGNLIFISEMIWKVWLIFISAPTSRLMAPEKAVSDIESTRSVQGTMIKISLLSYAMRVEYTFEPLAYGVHNRGVWLVDLVKATLDQYVVKYIAHGTGLINVYPGRRGQLMDLWSV